MLAVLVLTLCLISHSQSRVRHFISKNAQSASRSLIGINENEKFILPEVAYDRSAMQKREGLPSIASLIGSETKDGTEYELFGCKLKVSKDDCKYDFAPTTSECKEKLSLAKVFDSMFSEKAKLKDLMEKFIPILIYNIEKFQVDKCKGDVEFEAKAREPFDLVKNRVKIKDGTIKISINFKELSLEKMLIEIVGSIEIGGKPVSVTFKKSKDSLEGSFSISATELKVDDFRSALTQKEVLADEGGESSDSKEAAAPKIGIFTNAVIKNPQISGSHSKDGFFEMVLSGKASGIKGISEIALFLVIQKPENEATVVGVVADIKQINPAEILSTLLNVDLVGKIPLLGNIEMDVVAEGANKEMLTLKDANLNKALAAYTDNGKMISKGFRLKCVIPLRKIITKSASIPTDKNIPEKLNLQLVIQNGAVNLIFPEDFKMDVLNIVIALAPKLGETAFSKIFDKPPNITINKFDIDVETTKVDIELKTVGEFSLLKGLFKLKNAVFKLNHKPEGPWDFEIACSQSFGTGIMDVFVEKKGDDFKFNAKISDITTKFFLKEFASDSKIAKKLSEIEFLNFGIKDFHINSSLSDQKLKLKMTGNPVLFDWEGLKFEGVIEDKENKDKEMKRHIIFAVVMNNIPIGTVIEKIMKKKLSRLGWMNEAKCAFMISNTKEKGLIDFKSLSEKFEQKEGIFFKAEVAIPKDCSQDKFCEVLKDKIPADSKFILEGEISLGKIQMKAEYTGSISFGDNAILESIILKVKADIQEGAFVSLTGTLRLVKPALTFSASIAVTVTGTLELSLVMAGLWEKPFDIPFVAFGNLMFSAAVNPVVPLPAFDITGELQLGKIGTKDVITAKAAAGLDIHDPFGSYLYAEIGTFTIDRVLKAYGINVDLPKPVADTGFPDGVIVAYSGNPNGKTIPHMQNLKIRPGFKFYGKVNTLGLEATCEITISLPGSIVVDVDLTPIKLAKGALVLTRGRNDCIKGPLVHVGISPKTGVAVKVAAYAEILGIGTEVVIDISNKGFKFFVFGSLFNIIQANVTVNAPYGNGKIMDSTFEIFSCLSTSVPEVTVMAKETITDGADATKEVTAEAEKEIGESGLIDDSSTEKLSYWNEKIAKKEEAIKRKAGKLEKINEYLDDPCVKQCEDVCVGGPSVEKSGKKVLGMSLKKPKWDSCKFKVEDIACVTKCKAKKGYLKGKALKKKVTTDMLISSIKILREIIALSETLVQKSREFSQFVEEAAEKVEKAAQAGKGALDAFAKYTRENIIEIKHICFNTTLAKVQNACLGFSVDVVLGGKTNFKFDLNACLDASFIKTIAKEIADKVFPGIGSIKEKLMKAKDQIKNIGKKKTELNKEEKDVETKQKQMEGEIKEPDDSEDDDDDDEDEAEATRKETIEFEKQIPKSKQWAYIYKQAYGSTPSVTFRDDDTIDAFSSRSPWALSEGDSPFSMWKSSDMFYNEEENLLRNMANEKDFVIVLGSNVKGTKKENVATVRVSNSGKGKNSSCSPVYSSIVNSYSQLLNGFEKEIHHYHKQKHSMNRLRNETEHEIMRLSRKGKFSNDTMENLLQFVSQIKKGNNKWAKNVRRQIQQQQDFLFNDFKKTLNNSIQQKHGVDTNTFLNQYKTNLAKDRSLRTAIPSIEAIDQQIRRLLADENNTTDVKRVIIGQINQAFSNTNNECL